MPCLPSVRSQWGARCAWSDRLPRPRPEWIDLMATRYGTVFTHDSGPRRDTRPWARDLTSGKEVYMYRNILIPTDGSETSGLAVTQGRELARLMGAEVTFLHVLENPLTSGLATPAT